MYQLISTLRNVIGLSVLPASCLVWGDVPFSLCVLDTASSSCGVVIPPFQTVSSHYLTFPLDNMVLISVTFLSKNYTELLLIYSEIKSRWHPVMVAAIAMPGGNLSESTVMNCL